MVSCFEMLSNVPVLMNADRELGVLGSDLLMGLLFQAPKNIQGLKLANMERSHCYPPTMEMDLSDKLSKLPESHKEHRKESNCTRSNCMFFLNGWHIASQCHWPHMPLATVLLGQSQESYPQQSHESHACEQKAHMWFLKVRYKMQNYTPESCFGRSV